jgi:hypothetical protein
MMTRSHGLGKHQERERNYQKTLDSLEHDQAMIAQHKRIFHYGLPKPVHPGEHAPLRPLQCAA